MVGLFGIALKRMKKKQIQNYGDIPGTEISVDTKTIKVVGEDFDKQNCKRKEDYKSNQAVYKDPEGYQEFTDTGFCAKGTKCQINGIKMCIGIVVLHKNDDMILCHYVTGNDGVLSEKHKLQEIKDEMAKRKWNWDNSKLQLYYRLYDSTHLNEQNTSISIIANKLNISIGNIVLNIITDNFIKFN